MGQLMLPTTIFSSAIILLGILLLDCDLAHMASATGQLCDPQQSPLNNCPPRIELVTLALIPIVRNKVMKERIKEGKINDTKNLT